VFAHHVARGQPHPINAPFSLDRFSSGDVVDEHGAAAVSH
jgi:sarcosine oxidase subunit beta